MFELFAGRFVEIRCKLGESRQFPILRQRELDAAGNLLDERHLGGATHPGYRYPRTHRRPDAGVEAIGFEEDLAVGNRNHVGGYEGRNVAGLCLDDWQRCQRPCFAFDCAISSRFDICGVDTCRALEQTRVQVKDVSGICFTTRRTLQQQRYLAIGPCLFRQVIINDQRIFTDITEKFAHAAARRKAQ